VAEPGVNGKTNLSFMARAEVVYTKRCEICVWQKKGGCGTYLAIPRCLRHPSKHGGIEQPVHKTSPRIKGQRKRERTPDASGRLECKYCGRSYKNANVLRTHGYTCPYHPKNKDRATSSNSKFVKAGSQTRGTSSAGGYRCNTCRRAHQGRCGTRGAYYRCERKPPGWSPDMATKMKVEAKDSGRKSNHKGKNGLLYRHQARKSFFTQFTLSLDSRYRQLANMFWGAASAPADANRKTPEDPWDLLNAPLSEIQKFLGSQEGVKIHKAAIAFAAGGSDEARLLNAIRHDPEGLTLEYLKQELKLPDGLARWLRMLYHILRVAGCGDDVKWSCCGSKHSEAYVVGGGFSMYEKEMAKLNGDKFKAVSILNDVDSGEYDRCRVCMEAYNVFKETHCPVLHITFSKSKDVENREIKTNTSHDLKTVSGELKCVKSLLIDIEAASPEQAFKDENSSKIQDNGFPLILPTENGRTEWIKTVKYATTYQELAKCVGILETWYKDAWYRLDFRKMRTKWRERLLEIVRRKEIWNNKNEAMVESVDVKVNSVMKTTPSQEPEKEKGEILVEPLENAKKSGAPCVGSRESQTESQVESHISVQEEPLISQEKPSDAVQEARAEVELSKKTEEEEKFSKMVEGGIESKLFKKVQGEVELLELAQEKAEMKAEAQTLAGMQVDTQDKEHSTVEIPVRTIKQLFLTTAEIEGQLKKMVRNQTFETKSEDASRMQTTMKLDSQESKKESKEKKSDPTLTVTSNPIKDLVKLLSELDKGLLYSQEQPTEQTFFLETAQDVKNCLNVFSDCDSNEVLSQDMTMEATKEHAKKEQLVGKELTKEEPSEDVHAGELAKEQLVNKDPAKQETTKEIKEKLPKEMKVTNVSTTDVLTKDPTPKLPNPPLEDPLDSVPTEGKEDLEQNIVANIDLEGNILGKEPPIPFKESKPKESPVGEQSGKVMNDITVKNEVNVMEIEAMVEGLDPPREIEIEEKPPGEISGEISQETKMKSSSPRAPTLIDPKSPFDDVDISQFQLMNAYPLRRMRNHLANTSLEDVTEMDWSAILTESQLQRKKPGQCLRNKECKLGLRHMGFCGGWTRKPRRIPKRTPTNENQDPDAMGSNYNRPGQCTRNPNCKHGYRHVGFCGGWGNPKSGADGKARKTSRTRKKPTQKSSQPKIDKESIENRENSTPKKIIERKCLLTPTCPRPNCHPGICGPTRRVWYNSVTRVIAPLSLYGSMGCKTCGVFQESEVTTLDGIEIYSYEKHPQVCKCNPLSPPADWDIDAPALPVWAAYGSSGTWRELPLNDDEMRPVLFDGENDGVRDGDLEAPTKAEEVENEAEEDGKSPQKKESPPPKPNTTWRKRKRGNASTNQPTGSRSRRRKVNPFNHRNPSSMYFANKDDKSLTEMQRFAKRLQGAMIRKGMSQVALSRVSGVAQTMISKLIRDPENLGRRKEEYQALLGAWLDKVEAEEKNAENETKTNPK